MLTIRMQRTGRSGHAQFRMIVQDSRFHPSSGRVVAYLGNYDPHSKQSNFDKDKLKTYLANGAQPSPRVVKLLKQQKMLLPKWVKKPLAKKKAVRNPEKRRSTRPAGEPLPKTAAIEPATAAEEAASAKEQTESAPEATTVDKKPAEETSPEQSSEQEAKASAESENASEETPNSSPAK